MNQAQGVQVTQTIDAAGNALPQVLVWDLPVRVFHALLILSIAGAYVCAEGERWRHVHVTLGYTMAGLIAFRLAWGIAGTRFARFASFVRGPAAVGRYLASLARGRPEHHTGHNPAGAVAIVALLGAALLTGATGWASYNDVGGEWAKDLHEAVANGMMAIAAVHALGVVVGSWMHRENLVLSMINGRKRGHPDENIGRTWGMLGVLIIGAVVYFWIAQWRGSAPAPVAAPVALGSDFNRAHTAR